MKIYRVIFESEKENWINLERGYIIYPKHKKDIYRRRKEFNAKMLLNQQSLFGTTFENTFDESVLDNTMFFFLDFTDAIKYTQYPKNKFGSFGNENEKYKILELDLPIDILVNYLGMGNYVIERKMDWFLALELAIPFDELTKSNQCILVEEDVIKLNNAKVYDENSQEILNALAYINERRECKSTKYKSKLESILSILGFQYVMGSLYKKQLLGKERVLNSIPQIKSMLLNDLLIEMSTIIE